VIGVEAEAVDEIVASTSLLSTKASTTVASHTRLLPLSQGFRVKPSGLLSIVKPTGSRTEGRPTRVNARLMIELMTECLGKQPAFLMQDTP